MTGLRYDNPPKQEMKHLCRFAILLAFGVVTSCSGERVPLWPAVPGQPCPICPGTPYIPLDLVFDVSADGAKVVYAHTGADSTPPGIYLLTTAPDSIPSLVSDFTLGDWGFRFAPDGHRLMFVSDRGGGVDLWVWDDQTGILNQVTFTYGNASTGDWDPSGRYIIYSRPFLNAGAADTSGGLHIVDTQSLLDRPLLAQGTAVYGGEPRWSPDSSRASFWYGTKMRDPSGKSITVPHIYSIGVDGADLRDLTPRSLEQSEHMEWVEDGRRLIYEAFDYRDRRSHATRTMFSDGSQNSLWDMDLLLGKSAITRDGLTFVYSATDSGGYGTLFLRGARDVLGQSARQLTFSSLHATGLSATSL